MVNSLILHNSIALLLLAIPITNAASQNILNPAINNNNEQHINIESPSSSSFHSKPLVLEIISSVDFKSHILGTNHLSLVHFITKPQSVDTTETSSDNNELELDVTMFLETAKQLAGITKLASVNCYHSHSDNDNTDILDICKQYGFDETSNNNNNALLLFGPTEANGNQVIHNFKQTRERALTPNNIVATTRLKLAQQNVLSRLLPPSSLASTSTNSDSIANWIVQNTQNIKVILLMPEYHQRNRNPPPLYQSLATDFQSKVVLFAYAVGNKDMIQYLVENYDLQNLVAPALVVLVPTEDAENIDIGTNVVHLYDKPMKRGPLSSFLRQFMLQTDPIQSDSKKPISSSDVISATKNTPSGTSNTIDAFNTHNSVVLNYGGIKSSEPNPKIPLERIYNLQELQAACQNTHKPCIVAVVAARLFFETIQIIYEAYRASTLENKISIVYFADLTTETKELATLMGFAPYPKSYIPSQAINEPPEWYHPGAAAYVSPEGWMVKLEGPVEINGVLRLMEDSFKGLNKSKRKSFKKILSGKI